MHTCFGCGLTWPAADATAVDAAAADTDAADTEAAAAANAGCF